MTSTAYKRDGSKTNSANSVRAEKTGVIEYFGRVLAFISFVLLFIPEMNPMSRISGSESYFPLIVSVFNFNSCLSDSVCSSAGASVLGAVLCGIILIFSGVVLTSLSECAGLGNRKMKSVAYPVSLFGSLVVLAGSVIAAVFLNHIQIQDGSGINKCALSCGVYAFIILSVAMAAVFTVRWIGHCKAVKKRVTDDNGKFSMQEKYRLFLMVLPVLLLAFVFLYLPVYAWRYSFFNTEANSISLSANQFVGFAHIKELFANGKETSNVIKNTLIMSGLGIAASWIPVFLAVLLYEIPFKKLRRSVQAFITLPYFTSWVLVSVMAFAVFSPHGLANHFIGMLGGNNSNVLYLQDGSNTWFKMIMLELWKTLGWSTVIYVAAISAIDKELREAAFIDGAGRWQSILHVILPQLLPVYLVVLLVSVSGILSNGMEQYLLFKNPNNSHMIEVLDLYVYDKGIKDASGMTLSTLIGMIKACIGIILLWIVNRVSNILRGESIV